MAQCHVYGPRGAYNNGVYGAELKGSGFEEPLTGDMMW